MFSTLKKSVVALLLVATLAPTAYMLAPQKAEALTGIIGCVAGALGFDIFSAAPADALYLAGWAAAAVPLYVPTFDLPNYIGKGGELLQEQATTATTGALSWKECVLDALLWIFKTVVIQTITAAILEWIANGFQGAPTFITDFPAFLENISSTAASMFLLGDELSFMCEPFQGSLQFSVALNFSSRFRDRIDCTLSDVVDNIQAFIDGFTIGFDVNGNSQISRTAYSQYGGAGAWGTMFTKPQNNPFGAYLMAEEELAQKIYRQQSIELFKVDVGGGYASISSCLLRDSNGNCSRARIEMPGRFVDEYVAQWIGKENADILAIGDEIDEILGALLQLLINKLMEYGTGLFVGEDDDFLDDLRNPDDLLQYLRVQLTFTAVPTSITVGGTSRLQWSTTGATECTATGGWTGPQPVNGFLTVNPVVTTTYTLQCSGDEGPPVIRSVTITVGAGTTTAPPPTLPPPTLPPPTLPPTGTTVTPPPPTTPPPATAGDGVAPSAVDDLLMTSIQSNSLNLVWGAPGDDGNTGTATSYDIRYVVGNTFTEAEWAAATQVTGEPVPEPSGTIQTMTVTGLTPSTTYTFAMKAIDEGGLISPISTPNPTGTTSAAPATGGPSSPPPPPSAPPA